jgi:hypothetical protein
MRIVGKYHGYPTEIQGIVSRDDRAVSTYLGGNR